MVKSRTKIWIYLFAIIAIGLGIFILTKGKHSDKITSVSMIIATLFISILFFIVPCWLIARSRTFILDTKGITIIWPFLKRNTFYPYEVIESYSEYLGIAKGFSFKELEIRLRNKGNIIITSAANSNFEDIIKYLDNMVIRNEI